MGVTSVVSVWAEKIRHSSMRRQSLSGTVRKCAELGVGKDMVDLK